MTIDHNCPHCRRALQSPVEFAGRRVRCPSCGGELTMPAAAQEEEVVVAEVMPDPQEGDPWEIKFLDQLHRPAQVKQSLEPPAKPPVIGAGAQAEANPGNWFKAMLESLLDPRSIQWLLTLGGGLMVLGVLIWLISQGVLENPRVLAVVLGAASLAVLVLGWVVKLKTRFQIAGRALTFLGCVVAPLNLWFYHAQGLVELDQGLWVGGVVCVLLYVATVWLLRDALFLYAVEAGITLTAVLFLGNLGLAGHATQLSILLVTLALISIHAQRAFPADGPFNQQQFGLPLFWSGHLQLAAGLGVLLATQLAGAFVMLGNYFALPPDGVLLTNSRWTAGLLWLAGGYAYLYSDLFVRRVGVYMYLGAISLVMAQVSLIGLDTLGVNGLIVTLAITATVLALSTRVSTTVDPRLARAIPPLALILSIFPVLSGICLSVRMASTRLAEWGLGTETTWTFVIVMLVVAVANRISAWVYQQRSPSLAAVYLFFAAAALVVSAGGTLRMWEIQEWYRQAAIMMLVPLGYIVAAVFWRGQSPERPVTWIAHLATWGILIHVLLESLPLAFRDGPKDDLVHLYLAAILLETSIFYAIAATTRRNVLDTYLCAAATAGALWQGMLSLEVPQEYYTTAVALLGLAGLAVGRWLGIEKQQVFDHQGVPTTVAGGTGAPILRSGHALLSLALLIALMKGLGQLIQISADGSGELDAAQWVVLGLMVGISIVAAVASSDSHWSRVYIVAAIALSGVTLMLVNVAIDLNRWRKFELFLVAVGLASLAAGCVGRFREQLKQTSSEHVSLALWLGSLAAALPLATAVFYHWSAKGTFSLVDEIALLTVTLAMLTVGVVWRMKAPTLFGGGTFAAYLIVLVVSLLYRPQLAIGIYLAAGGALLFLVGLLLAVYRERLIAIPDQVAKREGVFRVIGWR